MGDFRNLRVWREGHLLALAVYAATSDLPSEERFGLSAQMRRSAASIPMNVAEGSGRRTDRDFARFTSMAIGSCNELEYQLILTSDLGYISADVGEELIERTRVVRGGLVRLHDQLYERPENDRRS